MDRQIERVMEELSEFREFVTLHKFTSNPEFHNKFSMLQKSLKVFSDKVSKDKNLVNSFVNNNLGKLYTIYDTFSGTFAKNYLSKQDIVTYRSGFDSLFNKLGLKKFEETW